MSASAYHVAAELQAAVLAEVVRHALARPVLTRVNFVIVRDAAPTGHKIVAPSAAALEQGKQIAALAGQR